MKEIKNLASEIFEDVDYNNFMKHLKNKNWVKLRSFVANQIEIKDFIIETISDDDTKQTLLRELDVLNRLEDILIYELELNDV